MRWNGTGITNYTVINIPNYTGNRGRTINAFAPALYTVVIAMTSSIVGNLSAFVACTTPVLVVKTFFFCQYGVLSDDPT